MGKSKIDGLFGAVLEKFRIKPDDIIFIGDSAARDVAPAGKKQLQVWSGGAQDKFSAEDEIYFGRADVRPSVQPRPSS